MEALISIIVPVYNVEQYLDGCIKSIINQTYKNIEIILIDDGSTDNCPKKCDEWAEKDSRIKVIHQKNNGVSAARNTGLDIAQGDYIGFVDSDDYIDITLCEKIISVFNNYNIDIVGFDYYIVNKTGKNIESVENPHNNTLLTKETALSQLLSGDIKNYFWNKIYKKHVFYNVRCPIGLYMEDMFTLYKLFLNSESFYQLNETLYYYCQRNNSIVNSISAKLICDTFVAQVTRYNHLKKIYPNVAEVGFSNVALSARALYDRSLWEQVDQKSLQDATDFLKNNKSKISADKIDKLFKLYYNSRPIYNLYRILRHKIGIVLKFIRALPYKC